MSVDFWDVKKLYETSSMFGEGSLGIKVSKATQVKKRGGHFHPPRMRRAAADGTSEPLKNMRHKNHRRSVSHLFQSWYLRRHVHAIYDGSFRLTHDPKHHICSKHCKAF